MRTLLLLLSIVAASAAFAESKTVTLHVKDAEAREVIRSMQKQCGIQNVLLDRDVTAKGATFYFRDVPCDVAFRTVFRTYGLTATIIDRGRTR